MGKHIKDNKSKSTGKDIQ